MRGDAAQLGSGAGRGPGEPDTNLACLAALRRTGLSTWIYAITRNRCLTALKQAPAALSLSDEAVMDEVHAIAGPRVDVEEAAQMSGIVQRLVGELPESAQRVIRLYYFEDRAVAEVALMLGQPEGTVKTHLHRARSALLQKLEALGLGDPGAWQTGA